MTVTVDPSVLVAALVDSGPDGEWAESALGEGFLAGPELALAEASNILRRLQQAGDLSRLEANLAQGDLMRLDIEVFPFAPLADRVWALRGNLASYDAWYVAVAEGLECPLVTLDRRLRRAAGPVCEIVVPGRSKTRGEQ